MPFAMAFHTRGQQIMRGVEHMDRMPLAPVNFP